MFAIVIEVVDVHKVVGVPLTVGVLLMVVLVPVVKVPVANFSFRYLQFNFVGRILGPRGMTTKQLEQETGCKIMVRGKGSMRDKKKVSLC